MNISYLSLLFKSLTPSLLPFSLNWWPDFYFTEQIEAIWRELSHLPATKSSSDSYTSMIYIYIHIYKYTLFSLSGYWLGSSLLHWLVGAGWFNIGLTPCLKLQVGWEIWGHCLFAAHRQVRHLGPLFPSSRREGSSSSTRLAWASAGQKGSSSKRKHSPMNMNLFEPLLTTVPLIKENHMAKARVCGRGLPRVCI